MSKHMLVTGGCGFIGSNFIRLVIETTDYVVTNLDKLTYAGNLENLKDIEENPRYRFVRGDIADSADLDAAFDNPVDVIVNFAAESHVDRSIIDSKAFVKTNISGTHSLLEKARSHGVKRFMQVSTDEVYGSLGLKGLFTETTPLSPRSPYSASKASADMLALSYYHTFSTPVVITRCSNNYGPYQFPEKLIPLLVTNALENKQLPVYGDGLNVRDWIHVNDHCWGILLALEKGKDGEVYNIGGENERTNIEIVKTVLKILGKSESLITYVTDRPGHDRRYAIDPSKAKAELGFSLSIPFARGMAETVQWYIDNISWWQKIKSGEYLTYYEEWYGRKD
jgi:dTDP-glucose 4,6-dehydratase